MMLVHAVLLLAFAVPDDFSLQFSRGPCLGVCPVSALTINRYGMVFYSQTYPAHTQLRRRMNGAEMEQLLHEIEDFDFFNMAPPPHAGDDGSDDTLVIRMGGREHGIRTFGASSRIGALGDRIEALALHRDQDGVGDLLGDFAEEPCGDEKACRTIWTQELRRSALYLHFYNGETRREAKIVLSKDGLLRLISDHPYVHQIRTQLTPEQRAGWTTVSRALKETRNDPRRVMASTHMEFVIPTDDWMLLNRSPVSALSPPTAALIERLADEATYVNDARSIRVSLVPWSQHGGDPWPAEDLVPAAQVTNRTFTPAEWNAVLARLDQRKANGQPAHLDGKPFGSQWDVVLDVIATQK